MTNDRQKRTGPLTERAGIHAPEPRFDAVDMEVVTGITWHDLLTIDMGGMGHLRSDQKQRHCRQQPGAMRRKAGQQRGEDQEVVAVLILRETDGALSDGLVGLISVPLGRAEGNSPEPLNGARGETTIRRISVVCGGLRHGDEVEETADEDAAKHEDQQVRGADHDQLMVDFMTKHVVEVTRASADTVYRWLQSPDQQARVPEQEGPTETQEDADPAEALVELPGVGGEDGLELQHRVRRVLSGGHREETSLYLHPEWRLHRQ